MNTRFEFAFKLNTIIASKSQRAMVGPIVHSLDSWFREMPDRPNQAGLIKGAVTVGRRLRLDGKGLITKSELSSAFVTYLEDDNEGVSPWCPWIILALGVHEVPAVSDEPAEKLRMVA